VGRVGQAGAVLRAARRDSSDIQTGVLIGIVMGRAQALVAEDQPVA